jgi:hypothetical protein
MGLSGKYQNLIEALIDKTKSGEANWLATGVDDQFILHLSNGSVRVEYTPEQRNRGPGQEMFVEPEFYEATILNDEGEEVDTVIYRGEESDDRKIVHDLFRQAKRSYLKADETIQGMLEEVKSDGQIGRTTPPPSQGGFEPDEELPF